MNIEDFVKPTNTNYSLHNNLLSSVSTPRHVNQVPKIITKEVSPKTPCTNQKSSGRCWIFAALNMLRRKVIKDNKLPESFEFSQSYLFFFDKLERMNYNLNLIESLKDSHTYKSRVVQHILKEPFGDGGQWVMFTNVTNKYGLVPQEAYPESTHSSNSAGINMVLSRMFRTSIKDLYSNPCNYNRKKILQKTYEVLIKFFGEPPKTFVWNYEKDKDVVNFNGTPLNFMKDFLAFFI